MSDVAFLNVDPAFGMGGSERYSMTRALENPSAC